MSLRERQPSETTLPDSWKESQEFTLRVKGLLERLLRPENGGELETFRFRGSTNRVYRIPLDAGCRDFVVVKLLPGHQTRIRLWAKRHVRNLMYRERELWSRESPADMEPARIREWHLEGFNVPRIVDVGMPGVRVLRGLHFPTVFTLLSTPGLSIESKVDILSQVTKSMSFQHSRAFQTGRKSLIHRDPGPWNVMYDSATRSVCWFDLEQPSDVPGMDVETLAVRAVRIHLFGFLDHLHDHLETVINTVVMRYEIKDVLFRLAASLDESDETAAGRVVRLLRARNQRYEYRARIAPALRAALGDKGVGAIDQTNRSSEARRA